MREVMREKTGESSSSKSAADIENSMSLRAYDPPRVQVEALQVITLGGSPGPGDSGAEETQRPAGGPA